MILVLKSNVHCSIDRSFPVRTQYLLPLFLDDELLFPFSSHSFSVFFFHIYMCVHVHTRSHIHTSIPFSIPLWLLTYTTLLSTRTHKSSLPLPCLNTSFFYCFSFFLYKYSSFSLSVGLNVVFLFFSCPFLTYYNFSRPFTFLSSLRPLRLLRPFMPFTPPSRIPPSIFFFIFL